MSKYRYSIATLKWDDICGEGYIIWNKKRWNQWGWVTKADAISDWESDLKKLYKDNNESFRKNPKKALGMED
tara:strand:- start:1640 stop:1855 length:216 start_codon:yes stop_codon:yes gene_type:complete